ncbi:MAG TPA: HAD-IA family hydrolase [Usitatibacteraceae bacterium]|nr:HAD-IA family hydrolase [Usitatibacteraceae bacterium]
MRRYELVIFDWDGTIMDSTGLIASCIQAACREMGLAVPDEAAAKWVIGLGIAQSMERVAPGLDASRTREFADRYRGHFLARDHEAPLFGGIPGLLEDLRGRGLRLAVATGKSRRGLGRALASSGLAPFFEATRCADEGFPKPHPDMVLRILDETGVEASRAVLVGDTTHDLELAANAGVDAVAVTYGAHGEALLRERAARHYAGSVEELRLWLAGHA